MEKGEWKVLRTYKGSEKLNMFYLCVFRVTGGRRWKSLPGKSRRKGERASGDAQWELLAVNDLGEECQATPAIGGRYIYARTTNVLYIFGKKR